MSSLQLDACSLLLGACSLVPDPWASASGAAGSARFQILPGMTYSSSLSHRFSNLSLVSSWSFLTIWITSSNASAILFSSCSIIFLSKYILHYPWTIVKRCLLLETCRFLLSFFRMILKIILNWSQDPLHTIDRMHRSTNRVQGSVAPNGSLPGCYQSRYFEFLIP